MLAETKHIVKNNDFAGYVTKPFKSGELYKAILEALNVKHSEAKTWDRREIRPQTSYKY